MSVRAVAERGTEIDRVDLVRTARRDTEEAWQVDPATGLSVLG